MQGATGKLPVARTDFPNRGMVLHWDRERKGRLMPTRAVLETAQSIVRDAGGIASRQFGNATVLRTKAFSDIVTASDLEIERFVIDQLRQHFPDHGFDSEERGQEHADAEFVWVLDPIDGTKYYTRGVPLYSISLALEQQGRPVIGIVYNPETGQMYSSLAGGGVSLNGEHVTCSQLERVDEVTVCLEIPSSQSSAAERRWACERIERLIDGVRRVRMLGVGALGLAYCATGAFDVYVNLGSATKHCDISGHPAEK
jgi:myo-inositol-1(or 4)-monophosphatase